MKPLSRLTEALLETADDMRASGVLDAAAHDKITMRHLGSRASPRPVPLTSDQIRAMREKANVSQAVFARYLNVTVGYVSQLERGARNANGAALALLDVIRRKGIEGIL